MANQKITQLNSIAWSSVDANNDVIPIVDVNDTSMAPSGTTKKISAAQLISSLVPTSRTITINGTTQDLTANITWTIPTGITVGTTPVTSGTNGRLFFQAGGVVQQDAALFWDNTNKRLGIGTNTPLEKLHISENVAGTNNILRMSCNSASVNIIHFRNSDTSLQGSFMATGSSFNYGTYLPNQINLNAGAGAGGLGLRATNTGNINFYGGAVSPDFGVNYFRLFGATGNVLLQNGGTFTDNGFRLDINGTTRLNGNTSIGGSTAGARLDVRAQGALSTDIAFRVRNSADSSNIFRISGNGSLAVFNGAAVTGLTDTFELYSNDIVAGNAAPHFRTENGDIVKLYSVGGWGLPTGTLTRTTFDSGTVTLSELAERVAALITDLRDSHGLLKA